ncbi:sulfurtransferase TusA family protein [Sulfurisphaera javensis]|uniref:Sulfurtransferase TusA family protein n=1 Tax=Sulfurisphaera javensis TaxID=2049879 RepID=A0AAT9GQS4_9CREN
MMELKLSNPDMILDIERFYKLYCLKNIKKLDWGYEGYIELMRFIKFNCFIVKRTSSLEIFDKNGKFKISIEIHGNMIEIKGEGESIILNSLLNRIKKNIEEYGKIITKLEHKNNTEKVALFKTNPDEVLDLRGYSCPVPEIKTKQKLYSMEKGKVLEVLVDNPAAIEYTLPEVARLFNCRYEIYNMGDYASFIFVKLGNTKTCSQFVEAIEEEKENEIKQLIKEGEFRAFLYSYFDQIVSQKAVNAIKKEDLKYEGLTLVSSAPIGRGWLLTALVNGEKIFAVRLDIEDKTLYDEDALKYLPIEGESNVFYLKHKV